MYVCVFCCLFHLSFEGVDEEHVEEEVEKEKQVTNRKSLGIPELDPDALPSSHVQKYLCPDSIVNTNIITPNLTITRSIVVSHIFFGG